MGLFTSCVGGVGFVLIGAWEAIISTYAHLNARPLPSPHQARTAKPNSFIFSSITFIAVAFLSCLYIINSGFSTVDAFRSNDRVGFVLQLDVIAVASLFLLYSAVGLFVDFTDRLPLPSSILNLIAAFAFGQEFFLFYLQRKDPVGLENRYYDLLLVPILVCIFSSVLDMGFPKSPFPRLGRGVGLILQGTWFVQMGFSFYTNIMAHGCALHERSRGNYTVRCKGHPEYHRSKAIATLQFNCHLAFLVVMIVGLKSLMNGKYQGSRVDYVKYKPLEELTRFEGNQSQFTLNSDEEEETITGENASNRMAVSPHSGINGFGHH